jgi:hypothetical protein
MKKTSSNKSRDTVTLKDDYPKPCSLSPVRGTFLFVFYTRNNAIFSVAICDVIIRVITVGYIYVGTQYTKVYKIHMQRAATRGRILERN